jgi:hypothetical protein
MSKLNWNRRHQIESEADLTAALVNFLSREAKKAREGTILGRCEVITWRGVMQCAHNAQFIKDGRRVCGLHMKKDDVIFNAVEYGEFSALKHLLSSAARENPKFRSCLMDALNEA